MFPQVDRLPGTEGERAADDRDREARRGQGRLDVGRHVVRSLGVVPVQSAAFGHEPVEECLEVAPYVRVRVLLDHEARRGVADEHRHDSVRHIAPIDYFGHFVSDVIETPA